MKYHVKYDGNELVADVVIGENEFIGAMKLAEKMLPLYEKAGPTFGRLLEKYADRVLDAYLPKETKSDKK